MTIEQILPYKNHINNNVLKFKLQLKDDIVIVIFQRFEDDEELIPQNKWRVVTNHNRIKHHETNSLDYTTVFNGDDIISIDQCELWV